MSAVVIEIDGAKGKESDETARAVYEHPLPVRLCHWVNSVALFVLIGSGLQIFRAFPSFGAKIPQKDLLHWPKSLAIGGWLGGWFADKYGRVRTLQVVMLWFAGFTFLSGRCIPANTCARNVAR